MATCRCGAGITWVQTRTGEKFPIDVVASPLGEGRYRVIDLESTPWLVEPVTPTAPVSAFPDHSLTCPRAGETVRQRLRLVPEGDGDDGYRTDGAGAAA